MLVPILHLCILSLFSTDSSLEENDSEKQLPSDWVCPCGIIRTIRTPAPPFPPVLRDLCLPLVRLNSSLHTPVYFYSSICLYIYSYVLTSNMLNDFVSENIICYEGCMTNIFLLFLLILSAICLYQWTMIGMWLFAVCDHHGPPGLFSANVWFICGRDC